MTPASGKARLPIPPLGDVLEFMRLVWAIDHAVQALSKQMTRSLGVTGPQRLVIRITGLVPGISAGHLAEVLHVHQSTLTGVLARLQRKGVLHRRSDPRDRRRSRLVLTARGRRIDRATRGTVESAMQSMLARSTAAELRAARKLFALLAEELRKRLTHRDGAAAHAATRWRARLVARRRRSHGTRGATTQP